MIEGIFALAGVILGFYLGYRVKEFRHYIKEEKENDFQPFGKPYDKPKGKPYGSPIVMMPDEIALEKEAEEKEKINELYPFEK